MQVIKLTLIYGVLGLEQQFPGGALSIPQLRKLVEKGAAQLVVERNLPGLQRQILNLQTGLDAVFDRLVVEVRALPLSDCFETELSLTAASIITFTQPATGSSAAATIMPILHSVPSGVMF